MRLRQRIERFGLARAILATAGRRCRSFLNLWAIFERSLEAGDVVPSAHARYDFRHLTLGEALAASENAELQMSPEFVRAAFERGDHCCGAFFQGALVAYAWRSVSVAPVTDRLWIRVADGSRYYGYKSFVLPAHRGQRLIQSVDRVMDRHFVDFNVRFAMGYISLFNLPSLEGYLRQPAYRKIGYAGYVSLGRRHWTFRSPGARKAFTFERI